MRKLFFFIVVFIKGYLSSYSQQASPDTIYESYQVDSLPKLYVNGQRVTIEDFVYQNIKWKEDMNEDEKIILSYVINSKGYVRSIDLIEMPKKCKLCTKELLRVITSMPLIEPAQKEGHLVSVRQKQIFYFKIKR